MKRHTSSQFEFGPARQLALMVRRCLAAVLAASVALAVSTLPAAAAAAYKVIYEFRGGADDGWQPTSPLVFDSTGTLLYGVTHEAGRYGWGVLFSVGLDGTETVLHSFGAPDDGRYPVSSVTLMNGAIFGTTEQGGKHGEGTVWMLSANGVYKVLHSFGRHLDGAMPDGSLIDVGGELYGTTAVGGAFNAGTVFRIHPTTGFLKVLYSFRGGSADGSEPQGPLAELGGQLYGTTALGGSANQGTAFRLTRAGSETVLYSFAGGADGSSPSSLITVDGEFYGTANLGGNSQAGIVFKLSPHGVKKDLHVFPVGAGYVPCCGLTNLGRLLFGVTVSGGVSHDGTVFSLTLAGFEKDLYSFKGGSGGSFPDAGPVANPAGTILYGTTLVGGLLKKCPNAGCGLIYSLTLSP